MRLLGVDLGGTQLRAGVLEGEALGEVGATRLPAGAGQKEVLAAIHALVDPIAEGADAIGVGVPSLVDPASGLVDDAPNLRDFRAVPLGALLEARYARPVQIENDANAFVTGEQRLGAARDRRHVVGLVLGTGLGAGLVLDGALYRGRRGGAGELGSIAYAGAEHEAFVSGKLFTASGTTGEAAFAAAARGDAQALALFDTLGVHLGRLCDIIVHAYDPELIVLGGSVSLAHAYFEDAMRRTMRAAALPILRAALPHPGVTGAALLAGDRLRGRA